MPVKGDGREEPCPSPLAPPTSKADLFAIPTPDPPAAASAAAAGVTYPPLLAGVTTTPLPLVTTTPVRAETDAAAPSLSAAGGAPASLPSVSAGTGSVAASGKGVVSPLASSGGWRIYDVARVATTDGSGVEMAKKSSDSDVRGASGGGQGSSHVAFNRRGMFRIPLLQS